MAFTPEILNGSIVLMGSFAPPIFTPEWLFQNKLIGEVDLAEMKAHDKMLNASSIAQLECKTFSLQVTPNRFQIISKDVLRPTINDLAKGVISLLGRVVITSAGINFMAHYPMASEAEYHSVGDTLVPKTIWKELFPDPQWSAGLTDLAVKIRFAPREAPNDDGSGITIRVQPSGKLETNAVLLTYNNHANFDPSKHTDELAFKFLDENWDRSFTHSTEVFDSLLAKSSQAGTKK